MILLATASEILVDFIPNFLYYYIEFLQQSIYKSYHGILNISAAALLMNIIITKHYSIIKNT